MSNPITVGFSGLTKRIFAGRSKPGKLAPGVRQFTGENLDGVLCGRESCIGGQSIFNLVKDVDSQVA